MIRPTGVSHVATVTSDLDRYRRFYEDVIGVETALVLGPGQHHGRHAIFFAGDSVLHVFEVAGYDPPRQGIGTSMFERGRLDHLGFGVPDRAALEAVRDRLVEAGATTGEVETLGPTLSVRFTDPDGFEGEIDCLDPAFDPSTFGADDEVVDPDWMARVERLFQAGGVSAVSSS